MRVDVWEMKASGEKEYWLKLSSPINLATTEYSHMEIPRVTMVLHFSPCDILTSTLIFPLHSGAINSVPVDKDLKSE